MDSHGSKTSTPDYTVDRQFIKEIVQNYFGGILNVLTYKGFQFEVLFQFVKQTGRNYLYYYGQPAGVFNGSSANRPVNDLKRWRSSGDITNIQQFTYSGTSAYNSWSNSLSGSNTISDASYVRVKNLYLSYQIPSVLLHKMKINSIKLYIQGQNLLTFTNYLGLDPETQGFSLPPIKMIASGIQITL